MNLLKLTTDDAKFQNYLRGQMNYLFTRVGARPMLVWGLKIEIVGGTLQE